MDPRQDVGNSSGHETISNNHASAAKVELGSIKSGDEPLPALVQCGVAKRKSQPAPLYFFGEPLKPFSSLMHCKSVDVRCGAAHLQQRQLPQ